jgi:hypothetical protein
MMPLKLSSLLAGDGLYMQQFARELMVLD